MTPLDCELMFESKTKFASRLTDAVDLLIDFATLGEYGLEAVPTPSPPCEVRRRRSASPSRRRTADRSLTTARV